MNYQRFIDCFSKVNVLSLPGKQAHLEVAPLHRYQSLKDEHYQHLMRSAKEAAVLLYCYPREDKMQLTLIQRTLDGGVHSGQIAFPGGKMEGKDSSLWSTALRECEEELGTRPKAAMPLLSLTPIYIPPSDFMVSPFLAVDIKAPKIKIDPREVALHIELPIEKLIALKIKQKPIPEGSLKNTIVPCYTYESHFIWGATAMILTEFKFVLQNSISN